MIRFKKIAASVAALATALSLSVGTLAVTANEIKKDINKTFAEKAFVNSFYDDDCSTVAKYLLKSGISLDEAKKIMELYVEGEEEERAAKKVSGTKGTGNVTEFYSTTKLSYCKHYAVIISDTGRIHHNNLNFLVNGDDSTVTMNNATGLRSLNVGTSLSSVPVPYTPCIYNIYGDVNMTSPMNMPASICDFSFNILSDNITEKDVHDVIELDAYIQGDSGSLPQYSIETYAIGDFDHNGRVDVRDLRSLANHVSGIANSIPNTYSDIDSATAEKVNLLSVDMDRNNRLNSNDVSKLTNYILTHGDSER